jgi:hypothetical protein
LTGGVLHRRQRKAAVREEQLRNWKMVESFRRVLERVYQEEDQPPTLADPRRKVGVSGYLSLFLLGIYNPVIESMRGLCAASELEPVQETIGGRAIHPASFSEMQRVLDPEVLHAVFQDLAVRMPVSSSVDPKLRELDLVAQDGSLWRGLPRMTWAEYGVGPDGQAKGVRLHLRFHLARNVPWDARVERGKSCERQALRQMLVAGQITTADRLYGEDYRLLAQVDEAKAFFVFRIKDSAVVEEQQSLPISAADQQAGVVRHAWVRLGAQQSKRSIRVRLVEIRTPTHQILLVTNLPVEQYPAELIGGIYRRRWQIELFFRWIKCILGNRHLFAESLQGVAIQMYLALIAGLLFQLYTGQRPTKRQMEAIQFYLMGWASEEKLAYLLKRGAAKSVKKP